MSIQHEKQNKISNFKLQKLGCVSDMLATMKLLCLHMWPNEVKNVDDLRLDIALRMLKAPHFNAKMNSLKEVCIFCHFIA